MTKPKMVEKPTTPLPPPRRYPEVTTPEQVAAGLGFIPPHQRPEVQERMRKREREAEQSK